MKNTYTVRLSREETATVPSLAAASREVRAYIDGNGFGASDWYTSKDVGLVTDEAGKTVARVSYNGRLWSPDDETEIITVD